MVTSWSLLRYLNLAAFVVMVAINSVAGAVGINGLQTGAVSDMYPSPVAPAGYVFAIWGVIYALLLGFVVYQFFPKRNQASLGKVGVLFTLSCAINVCWLLLWHYLLIAASLVLMVGLLLTLVGIYNRLGIGRVKAGWSERVLVHLPFSVYLGWITVATIANASAALVSLGQPQLIIGATYWTVLTVVLAMLATGWILWTRGDVAFAAVLVWALVGIYIKQSSIPGIAYVALAGAVIVALGAVLTTVRGRMSRGTPLAKL